MPLSAPAAGHAQPAALLDLTVSVVSHNQGELLRTLLLELAALEVPPRRVIVTFNQPEPRVQSELVAEHWPFELLVTVNTLPLGFGANHNAAFARDADHGASAFFAVINPDVRLQRGNPLLESVQLMLVRPEIGLTYPQQIDQSGAPQDHRRLLPTPGRLLLRRFGRHQEVAEGVAPDWVNAAFIVLRTAAFGQVQGFDPAYRMYCEDVDLCLRLQLADWTLAPLVAVVVHTAARASHRDLRYLVWHLQSLWRLWRSDAYRTYRSRRML